MIYLTTGIEKRLSSIAEKLISDGKKEFKEDDFAGVIKENLEKKKKSVQRILLKPLSEEMESSNFATKQDIEDLKEFIQNRTRI